MTIAQLLTLLCNHTVRGSSKDQVARVVHCPQSAAHVSTVDLYRVILRMFENSNKDGLTFPERINYREIRRTGQPPYDTEITSNLS